MFKTALKTLQEKIGSGEAHLITNRHNIRYLCGFTGTSGYILITKTAGWFFTDSRYLNEAKKIIPAGYKLIGIDKQIYHNLNQVLARNKIKQVYFEENDLKFASYKSLQKNLKKIRLNPQSGFVETLRQIKTKKEIQIINRAQRITEKTFLAVRNKLKAGLTEQMVAWEIEKTAHELGAEGVSFPTIVAFGANSGTPHHQNNNRRLKKGDLILIDMGVKYRGYCTDMTRIIFTAFPTAEQSKIYNLVLDAQQKGIKSLKHGLVCKKIDAMARDLISKAGYGKKFMHSLGHGVGLQIHEAPNLSPLSEEKVVSGSIITVEPGIYLENKFGIRIEDMVFVDERGPKILTRIPKSLKDCIIKLK